MAKYILITLFLLVFFVGVGQCPTGQINLDSQAEIDDFSINYPNCTVINDNLVINGGGSQDITNLDGLADITEINGRFLLGYTNLQDFSGLNSLQKINGFEVISNYSLTSFNGLNSLQQIYGNIIIEYNSSLINFHDLPHLEEIGSETEPTSFIIQNNSAIESFEGLESLKIINSSLLLEYNPDLQNFNGLNNVEKIRGNLYIGFSNGFDDLSGLTSLENIGGLSIEDYIGSIAGIENLKVIRENGLRIGGTGIEDLNSLANLQILNGSLEIVNNVNLHDISAIANVSGVLSNNLLGIVDNPNLSLCSINLICRNLYNPNLYFEIQNNAVGCNSFEEIENSCESVYIPDVNFLNALLNHSPQIDSNNDGLIQYSEAGIFDGQLMLENKQIQDFEGLQAFLRVSGVNVTNNRMSSLRLNQNTEITSIDFSDNPNVSELILKNGNNTAITSFNGLNCPNLQVVCVDDVAFAETNFTNVDSQVTFVDDCTLLETQSINLKESIEIYPNPVSSTLQIQISNSITFQESTVYSVLGKQLITTSEKQINMEALSSGVYFVKVITDKGSVTKKIVKQ